MSEALLATSGIAPHVCDQAAALLPLHGWQVVKTFSTSEKELSAARRNVVLIDASACSKYLLEGAHVEEVLRAEMGVAPQAFSDIAFAQDGWVTRLNRRHWYLVLRSGASAPESLRATLADHGCALTDVSYAYDVIRLIGPKAERTLIKLCSLELHRFVHGQAETGGLAKVRGHVARIDQFGLPAFEVHVERSLGFYVWETLLDAAREHGGEPAGFGLFLMGPDSASGEG